MKSNCIKIILATFILFSFLGMNINLFFFSHYHVDDSGQIFVHAHPFKHTTNETSLPAHHSHTKIEFQFLSLIYEFLTHFIILITFIIITLLVIPRHFDWDLNRLSPQNGFLSNLSRRGPPLLLKSI